MRTFTKDSKAKAGKAKRATVKPASASKPAWYRSPEEREAEAREYRQRLHDAVAQLTTTTQWRRYLDQMAVFRGFSANNTMLIMTQRPDATKVTTMSNWRKLNRRIVKGERGIRIFGRPRVMRKTETDDATGEEKVREWVRWPMCSVFDVTQTHGEDLVDIAPDLIGADPQRLWDRATDWLTEQCWTVYLKALKPGHDGYTSHTDSEVVVNEALSPAGRAATLLHELAHVLLHGDLAPGEYQAHRGRCEVEAEGTAYVAAAMLGFDTALNSIGYVAMWARGNASLVAEVADVIQKTATRIADALDGQATEDDTDTEQDTE